MGISYIQYAPRVSLSNITDNGSNISYGLANKVNSEFARENIKIAVLGCYVNIIHPDIQERDSAVNLFIKYLSYTRSFGAELVATETGSIDNSFKPVEENYKDEVIDLTIAQVKKMVNVAEKIGVLVGIEPGINHPIYNNKVTKRLLNEINSPNLKIILDPMNLVRDEKDDELEILKEAIGLFGNEIYAFHIKDYNFIYGEKNVVPVGEGIAPFSEIVLEIEKSQPEPYVILDETPEEHFKRSIERVSNIFNYLN